MYLLLSGLFCVLHCVHWIFLTIGIIQIRCANCEYAPRFSQRNDAFLPPFAFTLTSTRELVTRYRKILPEIKLRNCLVKIQLWRRSWLIFWWKSRITNQTGASFRSKLWITNWTRSFGVHRVRINPLSICVLAIVSSEEVSRDRPQAPAFLSYSFSLSRVANTFRVNSSELLAN